MENILILTKHLSKDLELFQRSDNHTIVFFDLEATTPSLSELINETYDAVWVWDLYFERLPQLIYLLLHQNNKNKRFDKLKIFTNSKLNINLLYGDVIHNVDVELLPLVVVTDNTSNTPLLGDTYFDLLIRKTVDRIISFRNEVEAKWPDFFKVRKLYILDKGYFKLKCTNQKDFSLPLGLDKYQGHVEVKSIIFSILKKLGIEIEVVDDLSDKAVSTLFYDDIMAHWVSQKIPNPTEEGMPLAIETYISDIVNVKESQPVSKRASVIESMQECTATNENGEFRYFISEKKEESIVIINALGLSIVLWDSLIHLLKEHYQVVVWETRCGNVERGGMQAANTIDQHANDLQIILEKENLHNNHIIAWCNGARIGIKIAHDNPRIKSLILLAPVFKGIRGYEPINTLFETQLDNVFAQVQKSPKNAKMLAEYFKKMIDKRPNLDSLKESELLGFSNRDMNPLIFVPMCEADYLVNYAKRTMSDESFDLLPLIEQLEQKVLLVLGENDAVVSNNLITQVSTAFPFKKVVTISGGSHYIQNQNSKLFCDIINAFLSEVPKLDILSNRIKQIEEMEEFTI